MIPPTNNDFNMFIRQHPDGNLFAEINSCSEDSDDSSSDSESNITLTLLPLDSVFSVEDPHPAKLVLPHCLLSIVALLHPQQQPPIVAPVVQIVPSNSNTSGITNSLVNYIVLYSSDEVASNIQYLPEFDLDKPAKTWVTAEARHLRMYKLSKEVPVVRLKDLETFCCLGLKEPRFTKKLELEKYYNSFLKVAGPLLKNKTITSTDSDYYFVQGLPTKDLKYLMCVLPAANCLQASPPTMDAAYDLLKTKLNTHDWESDESVDKGTLKCLSNVKFSKDSKKINGPIVPKRPSLKKDDTKSSGLIESLTKEMQEIRASREPQSQRIPSFSNSNKHTRGTAFNRSCSTMLDVCSHESPMDRKEGLQPFYELAAPEPLLEPIPIDHDEVPSQPPIRNSKKSVSVPEPPNPINRNKGWHQSQPYRNPKLQTLSKPDVEMKDGNLIGSSPSLMKLIVDAAKTHREYTQKSVSAIFRDNKDGEDIGPQAISRGLHVPFEDAPKLKDFLVKYLSAVVASNKLYAMVTGIFEVVIAGHRFRAMIDTGSELTIGSRTFFKKVRLPLEIKGMKWSLKDVNREIEPLMGVLMDSDIWIGKYNFPHHIFISRHDLSNSWDIILGQSFLQCLTDPKSERNQYVICNPNKDKSRPFVEARAVTSDEDWDVPKDF
ncbi:hypothetical protein BT96DRAFT_944788 [Gymnopus androsaceus JB14]|uniref:Uncharacterized protein n=1 Tax=Gymnopus androsaceus JB14 TaxID=1447944 RepID=A0A6A4H3M1_9AGAR|nr:hypothetical protein BT96DRAFT_944788 [Gymnopus androsaceus JB14]